MNSFSYTNPYAQPRHDASLSQPDTPDTLLHQLEMANAKTLEQRLPQLITNMACSMDWKMTHVLRLVDWFFTTRTRNPKGDDLTAVALMLVNTCFQGCDIRLVYSAAVHQDESSNKVSFLCLVEDLCSSSITYLRVAAISTLTTIWEILDRLQIVITCLNPTDENTGWWIPNMSNEKWEETFKFVIQSMGQKDHNGVLPSSDKPLSNLIRMDEWRATCASFLSQLLQNQQHEWIYMYNEQFFETFLQSLAKEALRFNDSNMPPTHYTKLSLKCFQLCVALSEKQSTHEHPEDLSQYMCIQDSVSTVVAAALSEQENLLVSQWAQDALITLFRSALQPLKHKVTTHPQVRQKLQGEWSRLLMEPGSDTLHMNMRTLCLFYYMMESTCCQCLDEIIDRNQAAGAYRNITTHIWQQIESGGSVWAVGLYNRILRSSENQLCHNGLSSAATDSVDARSIMQWIDAAASNQSLSMSADYHTATTICLLDMAFIVTTMNKRLGEEVCKTMPNETLERLICSITPKTTRMGITTGGYVNQSFQSEESTPPANNLSRTDDTCIVVEEDMKSNGFDIFLRISTASLLTSLAKLFNEENATSLTSNQQQRIMKSIHDGIFEQNDALISPLCDNVSQEIIVRKLRLFLKMAENGNGHGLLCSLLSAEMSQKRLVAQSRRKINEHLRDLQLSRERERALQTKCESLECQVSQQSIVFQRQKLDSVHNIEIQAKHQIEMHQRERKRAEQHVEELSVRVQEADKVRQEYNQLLEQCRITKHDMDTKLEYAERQCTELKTRNFELTAALESKESETHRLATELESLKHTRQETATNEKLLKEQVESLEQDLECAEDMNHELRDSLENIFSDMSKLARLFQEKEKELQVLKENEANKTENIERRLRSQELRNKEMQEQLRQLKYDNEVLSKKYETAKERIQKERKDRQKDLERVERRMKSSNVSYINQLHQSSSSRSRLDKENESYRSYR